MEYRTMPHTGDAFSTIAIGGANLSALSDGEMAQLLDCAEEHGLNVIDLAVDSSQPFSPAWCGASRTTRKNAPVPPSGAEF